MSKPSQTSFNSEFDEAGISFALLQMSNFNSSHNPINSEATSDKSEPSQSLKLQLGKADNLWKQGNISEAISLYCQAIEQQPNSTELYEQLLAVLKQQEQLASAYTKLAEQLKKRGETKDAAACYRQAIVLQAINERAQKSYQKSQTSALVVRPNSQITELADSAFSFVPLSSLSHQTGNQQILQISLDGSYKVGGHNLQNNHKAIDDPKKIAKIYLKEALEYSDRQEWEQAAKACQKAIDIAPDMAAAYKILGNAFQRMGKTSSAMDCYAKALEIQPDLAEVYARIGSLYAQQEEWQPAIEYYQKAIVIRPNFSQAYRSLGEIWSLVGDLDKAESCRQQALSIESSQLNSTESETQLLALESQPSKVIAELPTTTTKTNAVIEYQKLAQELEKQQKWQQAALYYRKALEINLSDSSTLDSPKTQPQQQLPQSEQPLQLPTQNSHPKLFSTTADSSIPKTEATETSPPTSGSTSSVEASGEITNNQPTAQTVKPSPSQLDKAINRYLKQTEFQPNSAKIKTDLGNLYSKKRQWKIAIAAYRQAIKIDDSYAPAYLNLAKILAKLGKNRESLSYMYRALTLNPEILSAKDYFYMGKSFIEQGKLRNGLSYCLKAVKLDPNYQEVYYHLGTVMSHQGQQQKAINYFRQALKRNPRDPQTYYILGQILSAQNNWDEAVKAYRKVLTIQPEFPHASEKLDYTLAEKLKQEHKLNQINSN